MNKHTKLFVVFLFALLAVLIIASVSFSLDISHGSEESRIETSDVSVNANGKQIFQSEDGLYGVEDASGNTLIDAQWVQLRFLNTDHLSAVTETDDGLRMGVLDLDGNVAAPFVYDTIEPVSTSYFRANFADSEQCVLYDSTFCAVESEVWDSCLYEDAQIVLTKAEDVYHFAVADNGLVLTEISLTRTLDDGNTFETDLAHADVALLTATEWSYTADRVQQLLEMIRSDDFTALLSVTDQSHEESVLTAASQISQSIRRLDRTAYLIVSGSEDNALTVVWQIDASVRTEETASQEQTITMTMTKNEYEVWVITELQFG